MLYFIGKGIFTTDGPFWQHSRSILRPNFDKSLISALDQFEPYVQKLIGRIPKDGSTVDLQDLFHQLSMDTSTDFILEHGTDYLGGDKNAAMLDESINKCVEYGSWREMTDPFYWLVPNAEAKKALKYAHAAVDGWVKQAMEHKDSADLDGKGKDSGKRYVFINELARHKEVDAIRIRDEVMNIILAGKDTTASLLSGLWFCLAREPEVYKKLQAEVAELNGERPSYESLRNMKYLKYTVQEGEDVPDFHLPLTRKKLTKTSFPSPPPLHPSPTLRQTRPQRHRPPPRRRQGRPATSLRPQGLKNPLQHLLHDAPALHLRRGRRGLPPRALGRPISASWMGLLAFRRWAESLSGPAVCSDGDVLCYYQDVAAFREAGV
jgi:hypothetical protein